MHPALRIGRSRELSAASRTTSSIQARRKLVDDFEKLQLAPTDFCRPFDVRSALFPIEWNVGSGPQRPTEGHSPRTIGLNVLSDAILRSGFIGTMDTSGTIAGRTTAVRSAAKWGIVAFVGEGGQAVIEVSPEMIRKHPTVLGSWTFSTVGQADCARFVADEGLPVDDLFSHRWPLDRAVEAYASFDKGASAKAFFAF